MSKYTALYKLPLPPSPELAVEHGEARYYSYEHCYKCNNAEPIRYVADGSCFGCAQREFKQGLWAVQNDPTNTDPIAATPGEAIELGLNYYFTGNACRNAPHAEKKSTISGKCLNCADDSPRQLAIAAGETYYTPTKACGRCGTVSPKRVDNGACTGCKPRRTSSPRQEAIAEGRAWYMPLEACKRCGEVAERAVSNGVCKGCQSRIEKKPRATSAHEPSETLMRDCPDMLLERESARTMGFKVYRTGTYCRKGHDGYRYVSTGACVDCKKGV